MLNDERQDLVFIYPECSHSSVPYESSCIEHATIILYESNTFVVCFDCATKNICASGLGHVREHCSTAARTRRPSHATTSAGLLVRPWQYTCTCTSCISSCMQKRSETFRPLLPTWDKYLLNTISTLATQQCTVVQYVLVRYSESSLIKDLVGHVYQNSAQYGF